MASRTMLSHWRGPVGEWARTDDLVRQAFGQEHRDWRTLGHFLRIEVRQALLPLGWRWRCHLCHELCAVPVERHACAAG